MAASVNKNRTAQQIRADRNFQKQIEEHVKISGRRIIVLSLEDNKVAKLGEESLVRLAVERDAQCYTSLPKSGYSKWEKTTKSKQSALWCNEIYYPNNKIYLYYTTNKLYHEPFNTLHTKTLYTSSIYSRFIWGVALRSCIWLVETSLFFCHFTHLSRAYSLCRNYHQMPLSILY